jgi:hypothetical protein
MVRSVTPAGRLSGPRLLSRFSGARFVAVFVFFGPALLLASWLFIHRVPGVAPWLADSLRSVLGVDAVARLEEAAYGVEDKFYAVWRRGEAPRAYWQVPPEPTVAAALPNPLRPMGPEVTAPDVVAPEVVAGPELKPFRPGNVGPALAGWGAPGDGQWVVLPEATPPQQARMYKTLLHPDKERSWAELFVVALDLRRLRVYLVPGTVEPQATLEEGLKLQRTGRIPDEHHATVVAAFNGGFKTEHGHYGMSVNGVTLVAAQETSCTVAYFKDHSLRIGSWSKLKDELDETAWWRQTPTCMFEDGAMHPRMAEGFVTRWGSQLDGETVIRRSAMGIDAAGKTLFVGISNHTTAPAIATGMRHAGAVTVAQLDINFSFPKFVTFRTSSISKLRLAVPLAEGFEFSEHEYLRKASSRDFFYVMDGSMDGRTARK